VRYVFENPRIGLSGSHVSGSEAETINSRPIGYTVMEIRTDFLEHETYSFVLKSSSKAVSI